MPSRRFLASSSPSVTSPTYRRPVRGLVPSYEQAADGYVLARTVVAAHADEFSATDLARLQELDDDAMALGESLQEVEAILSEEAKTVAWMGRVLDLVTTGAIIAARVAQ